MSAHGGKEGRKEGRDEGERKKKLQIGGRRERKQRKRAKTQE